MKLQKYIICLTVDNNRYGAYLETYCTRLMTILAANPEDAYYIAAHELQKQKRYKNATIRSFDNNGNHDQSSWSINFKAWTYLPED
jgi:hypothetical protein